MEELLKKIKRLASRLDKEGKEQFALINNDKTLSPFAKESQKLEFLEYKGVLSHSEYIKLKNDFSKRNKYLYLFEMTPAVCGKEIETFILNLDDRFKKAQKKELAEIDKSLYSSFNKQFDIYIHSKDIIRIEIKSSRASLDKNANESLARRAESKSRFKGEFHFQQLKPGYSHIFILVGIYSDSLSFYVLNSDELKALKLSPQHAGSKIKNKNHEDFEGQVFVSSDAIKSFECKKGQLRIKVETKYKALSKETQTRIGNKFSKKANAKKISYDMKFL